MNQSSEKWRTSSPSSKLQASMMAEIDDEMDDGGGDVAPQPKGIPDRMSKLAKARADSGDDESDDDASDDDSDDESIAARVTCLKRGFDFVDKPRSGGVPEISCDLNALRSFVSQAPLKNSPTIQCYVERDKSGINMMRPIYRLFLNDSNQFLLGAQKRSKNKTSNYLLSMDRSPTDRRSALIVGKLRSNWSGASYTIYDHGLNPNKTSLDSNVRCLLGTIDFTYDKMGPGRMAIRVPKVNSVGVPAAIRDKICTDGSDGDELDKLMEDNCLKLRNKRPKYDEKARGHVLNFGGRVTMSSIKNFQLECDNHRHDDDTATDENEIDDSNDVILQFGRVSCQPPGPHEQCSCHKNRFHLDFKYPLSAMQAFAICLAAMDGKLADNKAFEAMSDRFTKRK
ncbi:unnamed protein product [Aphanomyces euteiches]